MTDRRVQVPQPPHPHNRREPLPWERPKPLEEDANALRSIQAIRESPSYRLAEEDIDFVATYFQAVLPEQFDEYVWFDETTAIRPFETKALEDLPDTYPFGV
jgi:hypothetical protein